MTATLPPPGSGQLAPGSMSAGEVMTRFDVVTDKMANRFDTAVGKVTDQLSGQGERLARIEVQVSMVPTDIAALHLGQTQLVTRVTALERWRGFWTGVVSVVAVLMTSGIVVALYESVRK